MSVPLRISLPQFIHLHTRLAAKFGTFWIVIVSLSGIPNPQIESDGIKFLKTF